LLTEYGIRQGNKVIVGPGWRCVAEVMASAHGGFGSRITGQLVVRTEDNPEWRLADGHQ
jgi:hypothetical protein